MSDRQIIFTWPVNPFTGWGIYGINLALQASANDVLAVTSSQVGREMAKLDPARLWALRDFLRHSGKLTDTLAQARVPVRAPAFTVLAGLGNYFSAADYIPVKGDRHIGVIFSEVHDINKNHLEKIKPFDLMVAGSTWNTEILRSKGVPNVRTVLQGIDPSLFHPAPRNNLFKGRFTVFSGGKVEFRKGQDIVLKTFRQFQRRHPEALLVTSWHSPWAREAASDMARHTPDLAPPPVHDDGSLDAVGWAVANGIPGEAVLDLGTVPNPLMPPLLREMDAALFTNRCEGGTNLVAMEAMACGVPTILSANTGHLDLIADHICYPLRHQAPPAAAGAGSDGWGESDPEEAVAALEAIYRDRRTAAQRGGGAAAALGQLTWQKQIAELMRTIGF